MIWLILHYYYNKLAQEPICFKKMNEDIHSKNDIEECYSITTGDGRGRGVRRDGGAKQQLEEEREQEWQKESEKGCNWKRRCRKRGSSKRGNEAGRGGGVGGEDPEGEMEW